MNELSTRLIPIEPSEISYALNRHPDEKTAWPICGQRVEYRHRMWEQHTYPAVIIEVQDPEDRTDTWLWHAVRDVNGNLLYDAGMPRFVRVADPWPWVALRVDMEGTERRFETREARVRGSAGWLPLNWRTRPIR